MRTMKPLYVRLAAGTIFFSLLFSASGRPTVALSILAKWRSDDKYFYLESTGFPTHRMMVGITAWQQQVPLPQDFTGENAFRIPRNPVMAKNPVSAKSALFSGAIAVAINGVPIFNPIKNDGRTDTFLAGELDEFGGHCGRADDYHYHIAPLHLADTVGAANPIAYALDGFAIYGLTDPDGSSPNDLDAFNGHTGKAGKYHYHATKKYPYVNGGMRGEVVVEDDHITPQPRTNPVRPAGRPLRGAKIVGFTWPTPNHYSLEYTVGAEHRFVNYAVNDNGTYTFDFLDGNGAKQTETYTRQARGRKDRPDGPKPEPRENGRPERRPPPPPPDTRPDGVFADTATGLNWQKKDGGEMKWEAARNYCTTLQLEGHKDWRLPTAFEAFSILDQSQRQPALKSKEFVRTEAQYWWTSDQRADDPSRIWATNAGGGIGPHPQKETVSAGGEKRYHVRCVRGAAPKKQSLSKNADGTITDSRTGLTWNAKTAQASTTWEEAPKACPAPWRLPSIKELQSLNDESAVSPSVNHALFPDTTQEQYWSSTPMSNRPERAWTVDFSAGIVSYDDKTEKLHVRCVKGTPLR